MLAFKRAVRGGVTWRRMMSTAVKAGAGAVFVDSIHDAFNDRTGSRIALSLIISLLLFLPCCCPLPMQLGL
jgi:hypothetical protein